MDLKELEEYKKGMDRLKKGDKFRILLDNLNRQHKEVLSKNTRLSMAVVEKSSPANQKGKVNYGIGVASTEFASNRALMKGADAMYKAIIKQAKLELKAL